jgi:GntR family transcriptional repressor for pyruvate dehydrogenase complex
MRFHRFIALASGSPILAALMETVSEAFCEQRRMTAGSTHDRKIAMKEHREIYRAIRAGEPSEARAAMERHLQSSLKSQALGRVGADKTMTDSEQNRIDELKSGFSPDLVTMEAAGDSHAAACCS